MASVRDFPMPKFEHRPHNWCKWCCGEIVHGRVKQRSWHDGREDEPDCDLAFRLHTNRDTQFRHVQARDGLKCWDCGAAPERWVRDQYETFIGIDRQKERWPVGEPMPRYVGIRRATALEVDHETPLWSVAHLPPDERRPFFGPANLRLRCPTCHKAKTAREAAVRAASKRIAA